MEIAGLRRGGDRLASRGTVTVPEPWSLPSAWSCLTVVVIGLAVLWPLQALRSPILAYDGFAIWTLHSLFIYGGHGVYQSALTNPVYRFSNPNYPPLVPATGALGFVAQGEVDLRLAVIMTAVLNACALGAAGCAIVATVDAVPRALPRLSAPRRRSLRLSDRLRPQWCLRSGWVRRSPVGGERRRCHHHRPRPPAVHSQPRGGVGLCDHGGSDEARRFHHRLHHPASAGRALRQAAGPFPLVDAGPTRRIDVPDSPGPDGRRGSRCSLVVMALPGLFWVAYVKYEKIGSDFVGASGQSFSLRFRATVPAVWANLHVVPLAAAVAVVGGWS